MLRHPWQLALAILGVALGVAVVVAIDLTNDSARRAFALSTETLTGRATHRIIGGPAGLPDDLYRRLRVDLGIRAAAPLVEGSATAPAYPGLTLRVLGLDPLAEAPFRPYLVPAAPPDAEQATRPTSALLTQPGTALLPADTARAYGIEAGSMIELRSGTRVFSATILGLIEPEDSASRNALDGLMVVDIATAQEWFGRVGRVQSIDLILPDGAAGVAEQERIAAILPPGAQIIQPEARSQALQQMTAAFELNLQALSLLALIVGMFLIYNTVTFSVVQRRGLLGTLRCLGVARGQLFALVLSEALLLGLVGALLGLGLGILLGRGLVGLVTQTINDLYFAVSVRSVEISPLPLIKGFTLGLAATLAAAAVPALEAMLTPPRTVLRQSSYEERVRRAVPLVAGAGVLLLLIGGGLLLIPSRDLILSFGGLFGITIGAAALTPALTLALVAIFRPMMGRLLGLLGRMAAGNVAATLSRTSVAVAALMIAVAVTIGVGLMVGSFRSTLIEWLEYTLRADLYVSAPGSVANRLDAPLPSALIEQIQAAPGVERVRRYRNVTVESQFGPQLVLALDVTPDDRTAFRFLQGDPTQIWPGFEQGEILISESLAFRRQLRPGDTLTFRTDRGERALRVAGVFYDYGTDQGVVMMQFPRYRELWDDPAITSLGLYVVPGVGVEALVRELRSLSAADETINIRSNRTLRETSLVIFDRTFAITRVLQLLATIVSFIGILASLMALQLERARELGVLRANGMTPGQVWGMIVAQTGLMGLTAGLLAAPVGVMMAAVLVFVINKRSFGWTLQFQLDPGLFVQALLVAVAAALLAGIYPAWKMGRTSPALALREE